MPEILEMEARIKDYVSSNIDKIEAKINDMGKATVESNEKSAMSFALLNNAIRIAVRTFQQGAVAARKYADDSINKYKAQEKAVASLTSALGARSKNLEKYAAELQKNTTFGDELIIQSQSLIASFIKEEDQIKLVTKAATDLAAAKNMSLLAAADLITKSIASETNALSRYGIIIDSNISKENRLAAVVREVNKAFGDRAEAIAKTDTGKFDQLTNAIGDQKELLGKELLPLVNKWYEMLLKISEIALPVVSKAVKALTVEMDDFDMSREEMINRLYNSDSVMKKHADTVNKLRDSYYEATNSFNQMQTSYQSYQKITKEKEVAASAVSEEQELEMLEKRVETLRREIEDERELAAAIKEVNDEYFKEDDLTGMRDKIIEYDRQVFDAKESLRQAEIEGIEDDYQREIELIQIKYEEEQRLAEGNALALAIIEEKYELKIQQASDRAKKAQDKRNKDSADADLRNQTRNLNFALGSISRIANASKAGSAVQKVLDIGQATANVYMGITKAIAKGQYWQIPFVLGEGFAAVAQVRSQKYQQGGIVPGTSTSGDTIPALLNSREAVFTMEDQRALFEMVRRPGTVNNTSAINLNINVGNGGNYDMSAARYTVDALVPVIGDALIRAKHEGRLRDYETAR